MKEKQHITIHIADVAPLDLSIDPEKEEMVRQTAQNVTMAWQQLSKQFKGKKNSKEVLAMVAFQYARRYYEQIELADAEAESLAQAEKAFDDILLDVNV